MCDKCFLKELDEKQILWTEESIETVKKLAQRGLTEYHPILHSGYWRVTQKGKEYANIK